MINFYISLSRKKKTTEKEMGTGEGGRAWKCGKSMFWVMMALSWTETGVRDGLLNHFWLLSNTTTELSKPGFSVCKSLCSPLDNKEKKGRDCVWLRAWLTEGSSACLLFIKLHLLDRKGSKAQLRDKMECRVCSIPANTEDVQSG